MDDRLLPIIGEIYEASYRPEHWQVLLEKLSELTGSRSATMLFSYDYKNPYGNFNSRMSLSLSHNIEPKWIKAYNDYYGSIDEGFKAARENAPLGVATAEHQHFPDRSVVEQHELYTGYMKPQGMHHSAGVILFDDEGRLSGIGLQRSEEAGPYEDETLQLITDLSPHLQRALRIHTEFTRLRTREQALYAGFDKLAMGMVLFDPTGQIIYVNPMAESILNDHPAISLSHGNITTHDPRQGARLRQAILDAISFDPEHIEQKSISIGLSQPDCDSPLPVLVTPIRKSGLLGHVETDHIHAAMFFSDPARHQSIAPDVLQQIYGLTEREAEIAVGLCNGLNAEEISQVYDISYHTARTHIREVFNKTGVNSHAQLVKLLLSGPFGITP